MPPCPYEGMSGTAHRTTHNIVTRPINTFAGRVPLPGSPPDTTSGRACDRMTATRPGIGGGLCPATAATDAPMVGIAAGDGEILPPRYNGDSRVDADDWAQNFGDYIDLRQIPLHDARILLQNRLTGAARTWIDGMPADLGMDDLMERFRQRFGAMAEFWERLQGPEESTFKYVEEKARLAR